MMNQDIFSNIPNWSKDYDGENICYWIRELEENEGSDNWTKFVLVIADKGEYYHISIDVTLQQGVGDLLNSKYSDTSKSLQEAMDIGEQFVQQVENEYDL